MPKQILMIPGPVELDHDVLAALSRPQMGHVSSKFIEIFSFCLDGLREIFAAPDGQPFVAAGSGTLAMELAVANVTEHGDRAVVVDTGFFSTRMADILKRHGAEVEIVHADVGSVPDPTQVEAALQRGAKILAITHVDTSTAVAAPVQTYARLARKYNVLTIVDGVCAIGGQEFHQADWDVDLCLTGSQKALAAPPGLAIVMARPRAIEAFQARKTPVASYYCDWTFWLPVMSAYAARKPAYFATPAVNLMLALAESVRQITMEGMETRWARHRRLSTAFKAGIGRLGISQVPDSEEVSAVTLTTMYYPEGVDASLIGSVGQAGVVIAGGLHPAIAAKSFRVGHMGVDGINEVLATLAAIEQGVKAAPGEAVQAALARWLED
jgi:alanine-glyoxylate transaminase / serine-glyoxylate transaminase / serine-pyruvate transaminase